MSEMKYMYVESIKKGAISARLKSGKVMHLYGGLNKVSEKDLAELKEVPLMKAYFEAGTLIEKSDMRCDTPKVADTPEKVDDSLKKAKEMKAEKLEEKVEAKKEAAKVSEEPVMVAEESSSEEVQDEEGAE